MTSFNKDDSHRTFPNAMAIKFLNYITQQLMLNIQRYQEYSNGRKVAKTDKVVALAGDLPLMVIYVLH